MRVVRSLVVGLVSVMVLVGCGDGDDDESSQPATTVAPTSTTLSQIQLDKQKAQRIVLTAADVPDYTTDVPDPDDDLSPEGEAAFNACASNNPLLIQDAADDPRGAESPDFSKGDDTITVGSSASVAETEDQARAAMTVLNGASFGTCVSRALADEFRREGTLTNVSVTASKLPALTVGDQSVGYRFLVRARAGGQSLMVYADTTFIRTGRALAVLDVSSVGSVFPAAERSRLATVLAGRMAAP